jgi:hypothetical protein
VSAFLQAIEDRRPNETWSEISRIALIAWLVSYCGFLLYAATTDSNFLFLDFVNLIIHEAGHPLFSAFGYIPGILGGTLLELIVPLIFAIAFWWRRHTAGVAFCAFWFFENFLYIGTYMADARRVSLPLVGTGDHDWEILFGHWNLMVHDQTIGGWTRGLGWLGMIGTVIWLSWRRLRSGRL